jgi:hypothetical protein
MATPLTSGGKVSVTTAMRRLAGLAAKDSMRRSSEVFTAARLKS